jgi:hypothetical protein
MTGRARSRLLKLNNSFSLGDGIAFLNKTLAEKEATSVQLQRDSAALKAEK